jgi:hypothetical protein
MLTIKNYTQLIGEHISTKWKVDEIVEDSNPDCYRIQLCVISKQYSNYPMLEIIVNRNNIDSGNGVPTYKVSATVLVTPFSTSSFDRIMYITKYDFKKKEFFISALNSLLKTL